MKNCEDCTASMINEVYCHEIGCPSSWKDYLIPCFECGFDFKRKDRNQVVCQDCINTYWEEEERVEI